MKCARLFVLPILFFASVISASERKCIERVQYWGGDGPAEHLVVVNDHAFFGGWTLRVADLTDPTDPTVVHEVRFDDPVADLASAEDRIYVVDNSTQLKVIDATVPSQAKIERRVVPDEAPWVLDLIDIHGDLAMVGGKTHWSTPLYASHLMLLDVSDGAAVPETLGSILIEGYVDSLALGDHVAVAVTDANRIFFLDVSDPTTPAVAAEFNASDFLVSGGVFGLGASEDLLAISDTEGRVTLVEISVASEPKYLSLIKEMEIGMATVEFEGPALHVAGSTCTQFGVCGGYALINILAPRSPVVVGRLDGPKLTSPAPHAGHVMAAAFKAGMRVVDLRGMTEPVLLDATLPAREVGALASADRLVHVVDITDSADADLPDRNTLRVLQRAADDSLSETASYGPEGAIWAIAADSNYVAAAIYDPEIEFHSVEVIDVADPSAPVVGTRFGAELSVEFETMEPHLRMEGNRLYFSLKDSDDVLIYEVSEGGRATQVGDYRVDGELVNFAAPSDDVAVAAVRSGETGWVDVIDISDPSAAVLAARFDLPGPADFAVSLDAEGSMMAVLTQASDGPEGPYNYATLVDISDPTNPLLVADKLPANRWVAVASDILHGVVDYWFPPRIQHHALDMTDPDGVTEVENVGWLDVQRNRVDTQGPYFSVGRDRLEVYRYGRCGPLESPMTQSTYTK